MISGPIESHPGMSQRKRAIIHKMNVAGEKYLETENKFTRGGCMAEDCLHMEKINNFLTGMKTFFEGKPCQDNKEPMCEKKKIQKNIWAKTCDYTCETWKKKKINRYTCHQTPTHNKNEQEMVQDH